MTGFVVVRWCSGLIALLLVWMGVSDSLIAYAWLLSCLPVTTCLCPGPVGDCEEGGGGGWTGMCKEKGLKNNSGKVLESPNVPKQPQPCAFLPVLIIIRHGCHTMSREHGLWKAQSLTLVWNKWWAKVVPTSIWAVHGGAAACAVWSTEQPQNHTKNKQSNLEHFGFF